MFEQNNVGVYCENPIVGKIFSSDLDPVDAAKYLEAAREISARLGGSNMFVHAGHIA